MSIPDVSIEHDIIGGMDYVTLSDGQGNMLSIPNEDWWLLQQHYGVSLSTENLIDTVQSILYQDSVGHARFKHEWQVLSRMSG